MKLLVMMIVGLMSFSTLSFDAGKYFKKTCAQCHTVGGGDKIGPDLAGVSKRRTLKWITKFVNYPDGMINGDAEEKGYEKADAMAKKVYALYKPQLMAEQEVTEAQVKAILAYIDAMKKTPKGKITTLK